MKIAVYCGSEMGNDPIYIDAAKELGNWIGENGYTLIYGGGALGLMGTVAKAVKEAGETKHCSHVIGVVPGNVGFIKDRPQPYATEILVARDMSDRKVKMLELADAFIALPGGIGTVDEISEAITLTKIGVFDKPCIIYNQNGFYEPFKKMLMEMDQAGFLKLENMDHVLFSNDLKEIEQFLEKNFREI